MTKKTDLFDYSDYKSYLSDRLKSEGRISRGIRSVVSQFIGCQPSYLSQVLNGKPHLTIEQAVRINQFFQHDKTEARYFVLLLEHGKSGNKQARDFFAEQISEIREQRFNLKKRLTNTDELDLAHQHKYYSTWYYIAIHLSLALPDFQNPQKIAHHFNLPLELVLGVIRFLEKADLIRKTGDRYQLTKRRIYLERESDFIQRHHINWRSQSLQAVEKNLPTNLHYSNVIGVSKSDFAKIKEIFVRSIEQAREVIGPSQEEALYAVTLDCFEL